MSGRKLTYVRLSQCIAHRSFTIPVSRENRWSIQCAMEPACRFCLTYSHSTSGVHLTNGVGSHSCTVSDHLLKKQRSPAANMEFLARYLAVHVRNGLKSTKVAINIIQTELGCKLGTSTVSSAIGLAISKLGYDYVKGYSHLTSYVAKINSEGGYAECTPVLLAPLAPEFSNLSGSEDESGEVGRFARIFTTLANQRSVGRLARFVSIDAAHMKGNQTGMLLVASTQDLNGNTKRDTEGEICVLSQAIVPTEDYASWKYFLENFKLAHSEASFNFIISDRDKGLIRAISEVYPLIPHSKCLRHLSENFKKKFHSQELTDVLKCMALAFKPEVCNQHMELLGCSEAGPDIIRWIADSSPEFWVRSKFPVCRLGITTSNSVEIVFSAIRELRYLSTLECLLQLETYVCVKIYEKHSKAQALIAHDLLPRIKDKLNQVLEQSVFYRVQRTGENTAVITGTSVIRNYSVDIATRFCSCGEFQELGYPCAHAVAFMLNVGKNPELYCHQSAYVSYIQTMYQEQIGYRPTVLADLLAAPIIPMQPPIEVVRRGRPKGSNRIESQSHAPSVRKKRTIICPQCGGNHYAKTCPQRNLPLRSE